MEIIILLNGNHHNIHIRNEFIRYSLDDYIFEILCFCNIDELDYYEGHLLKIHAKKHICYNISYLPGIQCSATKTIGHKKQKKEDVLKKYFIYAYNVKTGKVSKGHAAHFRYISNISRKKIMNFINQKSNLKKINNWKILECYKHCK